MTTIPVDAVVHGPKYKQILNDLASEIRNGKYQPGQKLPSEAALIERFGTSRITVGRSLRELTQMGLVERVAGSGTFVRRGLAPAGGLDFGLLIPNLGETDIFEPICQGMAESRQATPHTLLWSQTSGGDADKGRQALNLCRQYINRKVAGVFFAPLEHAPDKDQVNLEITSLIDAAGIPMILLDRDVLPFPQRSKHDLVGIDNRRAAYMATAHLLQLGCRRVGFVAQAGSAPTVEARLAGYREALIGAGFPLDPNLEFAFVSIGEAEARRLLEKQHRCDGLVCANDRIAGQTMHCLLDAGKRIPQDMRIAGIDDVGYANLLPVPLTTIHQPCREIGVAAMGAMLDRIEKPGTLARDILLSCELVVRKSSGQ